MTILHQIEGKEESITRVIQPPNSGGGGDAQLPGDCGGHQVAYNRSARQWEVWDGEYNDALIIGGVTAFPAGKAGWRAAMLSKLTAESSGVAAEVEVIIDYAERHGWPIIDRAIRAGLIVTRGNVFEPRPIEEGYVREIAVIQSQTQDKKQYAVADGERGMYCECIDWQRGQQLIINREYFKKFPDEKPKNGAPTVPGIGPTCKHILAAIICQKLGLELPKLETYHESVAVERKRIQKSMLYAGYPARPERQPEIKNYAAGERPF